jgi:cytoskeletal protein CcmA (bactofilin family)
MNLKKSNAIQDSKDSLVKKLINLDSKNRNLVLVNDTQSKDYFELAGIEQINFSLVLNSDSKLQGTLNIAGNALIEAQITGDLKSSEILIIGENACINGNITGSTVIVFGTVTGDINASEKLLLCASKSSTSESSAAKVTGNICSKTISIQEGVCFEGGCRMECTVNIAQ